MSSHEFTYRMVLDDFTKEDVGVVRLDIKKIKNPHRINVHWIVDHNGHLRNLYYYRIIDKADYDVVTSFETHPELTVKYRPWFTFLCSLYGKIFSDGYPWFVPIIPVTSSFISTTILLKYYNSHTETIVWIMHSITGAYLLCFLILLWANVLCMFPTKRDRQIKKQELQC